MNGLKLIKTVSVSGHGLIELNDWEQLQEFISGYFSEGLVLAYLNYKVLFGRFTVDKMVFYEKERFEPRYLLELRAFDASKELHLKRRNDQFFWRWRNDGVGEPCELVEAEQLLWGKLSKIDQKKNWQRLEEERGFSLIVPYSGGAIGRRLAIRTRNYIDYNQLGQAGYVDSRLVSLKEVQTNGKG
jgi:CRISPR-associated protein (TIGR03984 family)